MESGQIEEALALAEGSLDLIPAEDVGFRTAVARVRVRAGFCALQDGDMNRARRLLVQGGVDPREVYCLLDKYYSGSERTGLHTRSMDYKIHVIRYTM